MVKENKEAKAENEIVFLKGPFKSISESTRAAVNHLPAGMKDRKRKENFRRRKRN